MAWWKFWTWRRTDSAHGSDRSRKDLPGPESNRHDPDDILMSISGLIDNHQDDLVDFIRTTRTAAELSVFVDHVPISEKGTKVTDTVAGTQTTELTSKPSENAPGPIVAPIKVGPTVSTEAPAGPPPGITARPLDYLAGLPFDQAPASQKSTRDSRALNRDLARKDPRKTLVAEDGQWPTLRGLAESLSEANGEDDDGPSPFQTMVPNDD